MVPEAWLLAPGYGGAEEGYWYGASPNHYLGFILESSNHSNVKVESWKEHEVAGFVVFSE